MVHYPFTPGQSKAYAADGPQARTVGDRMAATALSLPIWPGVTSQQVRTVASAVRDFFSSPAGGG